MHQRIDLQALARHLIANGYTTSALGAAIGLSQASVSRLAAGKQLAVRHDAALNLITLAGGRIELPAELAPVEAGHAA